MKKIFVTVLFLAMTATVADAKQRTLAEIKSAAMSVIAAQGGGVQQGARSTGTLKVLKSDTQLSLVGFENGGFAVIANDDSFAPVLGYTTGKNSGGSHSPAFLWWLDNMNRSLEKMLAEGGRSVRVARAASTKTAVAPLLTTTWGQGTPYNNLCPEYTENGKTEKYVTGCVATSMAQVMYYHKYPIKGTGRYSYHFNPGSGEVILTANFGATTYDYDNMLDDYKVTYTDAQANAVATLMYHCGVSANMLYNKDGSGTHSYKACTALKKFFGYDAKIGCLHRDYFNEEEWMNIIYSELSDACPIIYGGTGSGGGHSFILDGYDENGLVHVNWGWSGDDDGYFEVASMKSFPDKQDMIMVRKNGDTRFTGNYQSIWGLQDSFTMTKKSNTTLGFSDNIALVCFATIGGDDFSGEVALVAENLGTGEIRKLAVLADNGSLYAYAEGYYFRGPDVIISGLAAGNYRLYFASMSDYETEWVPVRSKEGVRNSYLLTISGTGAALTAEGSSAWTGIDGIQTDDAVHGTAGIYTLGGQYAGTDFDRLPRGVYVSNGRKIVKK